MKTALLTGIISLVVLISCRTSRDPLVIRQKPEQPVYLRAHDPGPAYQWIEGEWVVHKGNYEWQKGHWAKHKNKEWHSGSWQPAVSGWYWQPGHWETRKPLIYSALTKNQEIIFQ